MKTSTEVLHFCDKYYQICHKDEILFIQFKEKWGFSNKDFCLQCPLTREERVNLINLVDDKFFCVVDVDSIKMNHKIKRSYEGFSGYNRR